MGPDPDESLIQKAHGPEQSPAGEELKNPQCWGKFPLGQIVITRAAVQLLTAADVHIGLSRHAAGDWGDLDEHDVRENERSLIDGNRLLSAYSAICGERFWIITEADRSVTTILLPSDY
jgi:hypothetical protein